MRTGRKLQNRERVEKCKETLDQLSRFMGDILDGKLSQREAAEALGLTAQGLSHELDSCFKQYLKHSHVFSDEDIRNLLGDVETPAEKLAKDVLQVGEDGRYLLVNRECQKDFVEKVKNTLNKRDYFILSQYYGLEDGKKKNLTRIAEEMGVSSNYIGQRRRYSLRKLYQYKCCACLLPEYKKLRKDVREYGQMQEMIQTGQETVRKENEFICNNIPPVPIMETGMSAATKRSLLRGGVETLSELAGYSKKEVLAIRSIGEKGLREIREELAKYDGHLTTNFFL